MNVLWEGGKPGNREIGIVAMGSDHLVTGGKPNFRPGSGGASPSVRGTLSASATPRSGLSVVLPGKGKHISTRFAESRERTVGKRRFWQRGRTNLSAWLSV